MPEPAQLLPIYFPKECNLDKELFLPLAKSSTSLDCMVGYFTSGSLRELAESLTCYLRTSSSAHMRFIISPNLQKEDIESIRIAIETDRNLIPLLFPDFELNETSFKSDCVRALAFLIASRRLTLRIALQSEGLFHTKCWLFGTQNGLIAVHGSGNATPNGLLRNFEQLVVSRDWLSEESAYICKSLMTRFEEIWHDRYPGINSVDLNNETLEYLEVISTSLEQDEGFKNELTQRLIENLAQNQEDMCSNEVQSLKVPDWLDYKNAPYAHQGAAIDAWFENGKKGILSIATGGGKTLTSLVAASLLNDKAKPLFVVISVPSTPLLNQWELDIQHFGVDPINSYKRSRASIRKEVKHALRRLRHKATNVEVLLVLHNALTSDVVDELEQRSEQIPTLLIADEVHNLGAKGFKKNPPEFFKYKMGLSATYERQFDEEGTEFLLDYFGSVVFEYPLEQAIGECLVRFDYFVHEVYLTASEEESFCELTYEIGKLTYAHDLDDEDSRKIRLKTLCLQRRKLIEAAVNKTSKLDSVLPTNKSKITKSLIFCTDKYPDQIEEVNGLLMNRSLNFHQITQEETSEPRKLTVVVRDFTDGTMQVLTSKRILDEGFNVPQVETAYLLASNTVKRQWIQRLGRVLRRSPKTGKEKAVLHDFVVLPQQQDDGIDPDLKALLMTEYDRISFFSSLSDNGLEANGSVYIANKLLELVRQA
ncbi:MAG: DEAD/DEAH box helicase family protein [Pseudomonadota bacterium]